MATRGDSAVVQYQQRYDPWGNLDYHTQNASSPTTLDYTGQHKDDTGLLYYHARYYDPVVSRFMSADSIVPSTASGKALTVDFHETGFVSELNKENRITLSGGFWFQLSGQSRQKTDPSGPAKPQSLNRYSYVGNNPLGYSDATGHLRMNGRDAAVFGRALAILVSALRTASNSNTFWKTVGALAEDVLVDAAVGSAAETAAGLLKAIAGEHLTGVSAGIGAGIGQILSGFTEWLDSMVDCIFDACRGAMIEFVSSLENEVAWFVYEVQGSGLDPEQEWIEFDLDLNCYCLNVFNSVGSYAPAGETSSIGPNGQISLPSWLYWQLFIGEAPGLPSLGFSYINHGPAGPPSPPRAD